MMINYKISSTEYPKPQTVNDNSEDAYLDIKLDSFTLPDRLLGLRANYWINPSITLESATHEDSEVRIWISSPPKTIFPESGGTVTPISPSIANVTVTAIPRFGTPVNKTTQPSTFVSGTVSGEPRQFPFDSYSASIGEQNDFNYRLSFKFNIENHLAGFNLRADSGDTSTAIVTLQRTTINKVIPFIPLLILLSYTSFTLFSFGFKESYDVPLISNVALFLSILSLRALVVPIGVPFGCVFDWGLTLPVIAIVIGIVRIVRERVIPRSS